MQVAVLERPGHVALAERPKPTPGDDEVLVRVRAVGICGSDVHYFREGRIGRYVVEQPLVLGHECAGEIVDVGAGVPRERIGQRVAVEPGIPCRHCAYCKRGRYNLCPDVRFLATPPVDGAFAEYLAVPADFAHPLPPELTLEEGALAEPTAVAVHAARLARAEPGVRCVVFGAGPVGLLLMQVLRAFGAAHVAVMDPVPERRALAQRLGADDATEEISSDKSGAVDLAFDASGNATALAASIEVVRRGGRVVWIGLPSQPLVPVPAAMLIDKEVELHGCFRYANAYPLAIELIATGSVQARPLISHRFPLSQAGQALELVGSRAAGVAKALVEP
jgi:L-iditol 2-dehydrogenase